MEYQQDMDVVEVNRHLLKELESMGFPQARAARALHHSENASVEAAVNWIIDHENDPDIDKPLQIEVTIDIESPPQATTAEEIQRKAEELRNQARKKREEEEKKMEKEREKERIRAGKEKLQAKRIAEENERKRNIAFRKAEKEEEKRAREKIRQKLEADKAERRLMLGLSPGNNEPSKPPESDVREHKTLPRKKSVSKAEELRECLRSLRRNHKDTDAEVRKAFQTLMIYVSNVARNPYAEKFRKIRIANPLFQERVGRLKGGTEFLELCGFERSGEGEFLVLPRDKVDMDVLNEAGTQLRAAMTNPFFGLLSHGKDE